MNRLPVQTEQGLSVNRRYLTPKEAADYLGIGLSTLGIHRMNGTGPAYVKWATNIRYSIEDLDNWMAQHRVTPTPVTSLEKRRVGRPRKQAVAL